MNATVSTHNVRCYAAQGHPPEFEKFKKYHSREKLHVWMGLCRNGTIIGPHFFNRNVNERTYLAPLNHVIFPQNFQSLPKVW